MLLGRISLLVNIFEVKKIIIIKLWVKTDCEVGKNVFYSENSCTTSVLKKKNSEYLLMLPVSCST